MLERVLDRPLGLRWLCGSALGLFCVYLGYRIIHNVFLHPLRQYPGPWYWAACRLPYTASIFQGNATHRVAALHERYGDVVRIAPDTLSYITAEAWSDIYGKKQSNGRGNLRKDPKAYFPFSEHAEISTASDTDHQRLRRLQSYAFSTKALNLQKQVLHRHTQKFIMRVQEQAHDRGGVVDMTAWINCLTIDMIGDLAFSEDFGSLDAGELRPQLQTLFVSIKQFTFLKEFLRLPWLLAKVVTAGLSAVMEWRDVAVDDVGADVLAKRRTRSEQAGPDFTSYMLRQVDAKSAWMTPQEIEKAATTFIVAGSETTATLICGAIYLLLSNQDTLSMLTSAVRADFESTEDMSYSKLEQHEYLNAVLQESLRLYPPAPDMLFRSTMDEVAVVAGKVVPPHTSVTMNLWAANRSASNFHRPTEFLPQRWLNSPPAAFNADNKAALNPFSVGPRNCIGMNLAWIEMRMMLAYLLYSFDLVEVEPSSRDWIARQKIFFLWEKLPLNIRIRPRPARQQ